MSRAATAYIGIGSNLGDRRVIIRRAIDALNALDGVTVVAQSELYETEPVGGPPQPDYLNGVIGVDTSLSPQQLLDELLGIEHDLDRTRRAPNAPRTIDLDLLLYGDTVIDEEALRVPHPRMHERWFVLKPLADIAPDARHPTLNVTVHELLGRLPAD
jgi:2-amino-4-hydroxy-6-hydroxymethyldihydropteridine diphosphokinase